jgi:hypothetical protein
MSIRQAKHIFVVEKQQLHPKHVAVFFYITIMLCLRDVCWFLCNWHNGMSYDND